MFQSLPEAARHLREGIPYWIFWFLLSLILLLLLFIFLRDKDLRRRLSLVLAGAKKRMLAGGWKSACGGKSGGKPFSSGKSAGRSGPGESARTVSGPLSPASGAWKRRSPPAMPFSRGSATRSPRCRARWKASEKTGSAGSGRKIRRGRTPPQAPDEGIPTESQSRARADSVRGVGRKPGNTNAWASWPMKIASPTRTYRASTSASTKPTGPFLRPWTRSKNSPEKGTISPHVQIRPCWPISAARPTRLMSFPCLRPSTT